MQKSNRSKIMINFDENHTNSIKSTVTEHNSTVKLTTRFMKGKMLMFSKTLRISFVYDIIDVYCFPDENIWKIQYSKMLPLSEFNQHRQHLVVFYLSL